MAESMKVSIKGFAPEQAHAEVSEGGVQVVVDEEVYPLDALYGAAYQFIDRCYVLLDRAAPGRFRVTLSPKQGGDEEAELRALVGELANELLSSAWRHRLVVENRAVIEATTAQAVSGAMGPPSLEELADFDFGGEPFDDPLGIAIPWEEKYGKKKAEGEDDPG